VSEIPEFFKWRCTECRKEPKHTVYIKGRMLSFGECKCQRPRNLEMVPLTKKKFLARLTQA
jgi:hypothetical protein